MKAITPQTAAKLCNQLTAKLGTSEGSSGVEAIGKWVSESTWRYRLDDGSAFARMGFGPTRKTVTLRTVEQKGRFSYFLSVYICS